MAWTTTKQFHCAMGNVYAVGYDVTADSATLELKTPLKSVLAVVNAEKSMNSAGISFKANQLSAATAAQGYVSVTGCTSGDTFFMVVYGR